MQTSKVALLKKLLQREIITFPKVKLRKCHSHMAVTSGYISVESIALMRII